MILDARLFGSAAQSARTALLRRELALCKGLLRRRHCFFSKVPCFVVGTGHLAYPPMLLKASQIFPPSPTLSHSKCQTLSGIFLNYYRQKFA